MMKGLQLLAHSFKDHCIFHCYFMFEKFQRLPFACCREFPIPCNCKVLKQRLATSSSFFFLALFYSSSFCIFDGLNSNRKVAFNILTQNVYLIFIVVLVNGGSLVVCLLVRSFTHLHTFQKFLLLNPLIKIDKISQHWKKRQGVQVESL